MQAICQVYIRVWILCILILQIHTVSFQLLSEIIHFKYMNNMGGYLCCTVRGEEKKWVTGDPYPLTPQEAPSRLKLSLTEKAQLGSLWYDCSSLLWRYARPLAFRAVHSTPPRNTAFPEIQCNWYKISKRVSLEFRGTSSAVKLGEDLQDTLLTWCVLWGRGE